MRAGKALAAFVPSIAISYAVLAFFLACVELFAQPGIAPALLRAPDLLAQLLFTPLLAAWSIWAGITISARSSDVRVAGQLSLLASLPSVAVTTLIALNVIPPTLGLALGAAAVLLILDGLGWRITSAAFDRERLITGTTHWSQANYVALVTGQFTGCEQKDGGAACHQNVPNLFHQLDAAGLGWKVWLEAGTAKCDTGSGGSCTSNTPCPLTGFYTTGNPPILFDDIEGPGGVWSPATPSPECLANDVPAGTAAAGMSTFNADLATGQVASFNMVIPNSCDDGEADCKPVNNRYTQFDDFLAQEVPKIEASPAFGSNGVIIVTYDEDERAGGIAAKNGFGSGGHVVCAIISPLATAGSCGQQYFHYSLLRTIEDGFGLGPYLGNANAVTPIASIWRVPVH